MRNVYGCIEEDSDFLRGEVKNMVDDFHDVASAVKDSVAQKGKKRGRGDEDDDDDGPCTVRNCPCKYHK